MNGQEILATRFVHGGSGYDAAEVDGLLRRVAAELDAGRPAGPVIENAAFRMRGGWRRQSYYDIDSVDWFLEQLLLPAGRPEPAGLGSELWRDLPVAQTTRGGAGDPAERLAEPVSRRGHAKERDYFSEECANTWGDFGQQPGIRLRWAWVGAASRELLTMEVQTIASLRGLVRRTASAGERSFAFRKTAPAGSSPSGLAEISARSIRDYRGHFATETTDSLTQKAEAMLGRVSELVDETGTPILYSSGRNFACRAWAGISFPDQRWLRFLVRGTEKANAIMTAVDQAGNRVARYRIISRDFFGRNILEIAVHPEWKLTDELVLAIVISAPWLGSYFDYPGGGK